MTYLTTDGEAFIAQNTLAARTLTPAEVEDHATHHSGGLVVLFGHDRGTGLFVKMHDSWGPDADEHVIVHTYDPDSDDSREHVENFRDGRSAFDYFLRITGGV